MSKKFLALAAAATLASNAFAQEQAADTASAKGICHWSAGLKGGVYFFTTAGTEAEAVEEASMTIDLIKKYKISYPVFLDVEDSNGRGDKIDKNTRTQIINAYCATIRNGGYSAGVYANKTWLNEKMNVGSLNNCKIWLAQYNTAPTYTGHYDIWQYSEKGSVSGIGGRTDMNLSYLGY